uniref:Kinase n=1 Tax=Catharus ustulatus TaxID=91951 RepID=A0A8C3V660_CATUS
MVGQSPGEGRAVLLQPFVHQVGGHTSMLTYDEHTICKPLVSQELSFYESLPLAMRQFTPQYKGKGSSGPLTFLKIIPTSPGTDFLHCQPLESRNILLWSSKTQCVPLCALSSCPGKMLLRTDLQYHTDSLLEDANGKQAERKSYNPWGLHCHRQHLNRMSSKHNENKLHQFLLLENVVSKCSYPCILDLKMGTRQHGDDASEEKKARHIKKCEQSTSASLGVRICVATWLWVLSERGPLSLCHCHSVSSWNPSPHLRHCFYTKIPAQLLAAAPKTPKPPHYFH